MGGDLPVLLRTNTYMCCNTWLITTKTNHGPSNKINPIIGPQMRYRNAKTPFLSVHWSFYNQFKPTFVNFVHRLLDNDFHPVWYGDFIYCPCFKPPEWFDVMNNCFGSKHFQACPVLSFPFILFHFLLCHLLTDSPHPKTTKWLVISYRVPKSLWSLGGFVLFIVIAFPSF